MQRRADGGLADVAARAGLSASLAVACLVPVLFDPRASRIFDGPKILVLQTLAVFAAVALGTDLLAGYRSVPAGASRPNRARALLIFVSILIAAYAVSSVFSIAPRVAWNGGYLRRQGTFTFLSNVIFFLVVGFGLRTRRQVRWLVLSMVLASVAPTVYAICQRAGFDFVLWSNPDAARVTSTAGNSIFLGSYLVMVWPLTLALVAPRSWLLPQPDGPAAHPARRAWATATSIVLLGAQTLAIVFTGSVGVWLALTATVLVLLLISSSTLSRLRTRVCLLTIATLGLCAAGVFAAMLRPIGGSSARLSSYVSFQASRTAEVRLLLWRSAIERLREHPVRSMVGYGPDTIRWTLGNDQPAAVRRIEGPATADRSHNGVLDLVLTVGFLGLLAQTFLFGTICLDALRGMGLVSSTRDMTYLGSAIVFCLVGGVGLAYRADPEGGLLAIACVGGLVAGLLCFLAIRSLRVREAVPPTADGLLLAVLLAGLVGHCVASQTGIGTATSMLYVWLFAGLIVAVRQPETDAPTARAAAASPVRTTVAPSHATTPGAVVLGAASGLLGAALMFDFGFRLIESRSAQALFGTLTGATLLVGLALVPDSGSGAARRPFVTLCAASLGLWLIFAVVAYAGGSALAGVVGQPDVDLALPPHRGLGLIAALCVTIVTACAGIVRWTAVPAPSPRTGSRPPRLVAPVLVCGAFVLLFVAFENARMLHADELSRVGSELAGARRWQPAEYFYARALALMPDEDAYAASLGQLLLDAARNEPGDQRARLARAGGAYLDAHRISPEEPRHLVQLAAVESFRAEEGMATAEGRRHLETASQYLAAAARLSPRDPQVWNEAGKVRLRREDFAAAIQLFQRSLSLDDGSADTHLLYGDALVGGGRYEAALREYETAQSLGLTNPLPAISGSALALVRLNRPAEAIEANTRALAIAPHDYTSLKNLALLYGQLGELDRALSYAVAAADAAAATDRASVVAFVHDLRARMNVSEPKREK